MPVSINRQKLVDSLVDGVTIVRNTVNNRISIPYYIKSVGAVIAPAGATYIDISDFDTNNDYIVLVETTWSTTAWISSKSSGGFRINFGTTVPSGGREVRWVKVKRL